MDGAEELLEQELLRIIEASPTKIDLDLSRMAAAYDVLGLKKIASKVITVAGTNGKGSCVKALTNIGRNLGLRVGAYTSPHLISLRERFDLPDGYPSVEEVLETFRKIERAGISDSITWFEYITLTAFELLANAKLDWAILEVGLGGRLDAVNSIEPDISIVTGIALDHCDYLGDSIDSIAWEKAHVFRPHKPAICPMTSPPSTLKNFAVERDALTLFNGDELELHENEEDWSLKFVHENQMYAWKKLPKCSLPTRSCSAAVVAATLLCPKLSRINLVEALTGLKLYGRMQFLKLEQGTVLIDVAHNPESAERLATHLLKCEQQFDDDDPWDVVFGCMNSKDLHGMLRAFEPLRIRWNLCQSKAAGSRSVSDLKDHFADASTTIAYASVDSAIESVLSNLTRKNAVNSRPVVVCGSFYVVGEALSYFNVSPLSE